MLSDAVAETVALPLKVAPALGAVKLTVGRVLSVDVLLTVTARGPEVVALPAASRATARSVCDPFGALVVVHVTWYGAAVSAAPRLVPSSVNCTLVTPMLSVAVAATVTEPLIVAPLAGAVTLTVGAVVSGVVLLTVTVTAPDVAVLPAASRATARTARGPLLALTVFQLSS